MLKSYNTTTLFILFTMLTLSIVAQEKELYKEVLLDGKPAILNIKTGEITLKSGIKEQSTKAVIKSSEIKNSKNTNSESKLKITKPKNETAEVSDFHIVKAGETLFGLSKRYKTTLTKLKLVNSLSTTLIRVGQTLLVKNFDTHASSIEDSEFWIVSKGDTLYNIAKRNNISVIELKQLNALKTNTIYIDQKLRLK